MINPVASKKGAAVSGHLLVHHEPSFQWINKNMARKDLNAILIYVAAILVAFIYTPLALVLIALPATMYFLQKHKVAKFER